MDWLSYISLMAKRPTALKYTGFYQELPEVWQDYLSDLPSDKKRDALLTLNTMLQEHNIAAAADALEIALEVVKVKQFFHRYGKHFFQYTVRSFFLRPVSSFF